MQISIAYQFHISIAWIAVAATLVYYYLLDVKLVIVMTFALGILTWIATLIVNHVPLHISLSIFLTTLICGWALQFIGHAIEGNRPAFTKGLTQLIIAPLFLAVEIAHLKGYRKDLMADDQ